MQDERLAGEPRSALREGSTAGPAPLPSGNGRAAAPPAPLPRVHTRVRHGMRRPHNWLQLVKFCLVGGSGFVVNLTAFAIASEAFGFHHLASAGVAYAVAVTNNFLWNRHWTFRAGEGHAGFQAARFFAVSTSAAILAAAILELEVSVVGVPEVPAQAISIVMATPLNFIGNKMWSFGRRHAGATA